VTRLAFKLMLILTGALAPVGCSESTERQVAVFPVDGQLVVGGKPAIGAVVTFHPAASDSVGKESTAVVRADGHFVATQPDGANGLPEGDYALTVIWPEGENDHLNGKYGDPTSPISRITVKPGVNLLPPVRLP